MLAASKGGPPPLCAGALAAAGDADAAALSGLDARLAVSVRRAQLALLFVLAGSACQQAEQRAAAAAQPLCCACSPQSLEGAIASLQAVQRDSLARLDAGLQQAAEDATGAVQAAVREETYRSLEPLRRLPELLAAAMPVTPEVLAPLDRALVGGCPIASWVPSRACFQLPAHHGTLHPSSPHLHGSSSPMWLQPVTSEESLRAVVGDALGAAVREILEQQAALLEELAGQPQVGRALKAPLHCQGQSLIAACWRLWRWKGGMAA